MYIKLKCIIYISTRQTDRANIERGPIKGQGYSRYVLFRFDFGQMCQLNSNVFQRILLKSDTI